MQTGAAERSIDQATKDFDYGQFLERRSIRDRVSCRRDTPITGAALLADSPSCAMAFRSCSPLMAVGSCRCNRGTSIAN